jgi:hypothetical protein
MAWRMRGYDEAQARQIFRDLIDMAADVTVSEREVTVRFHRRAHLPIVPASGLIGKPVPVPWWNGLPLRLLRFNNYDDPKLRGKRASSHQLSLNSGIDPAR